MTEFPVYGLRDMTFSFRILDQKHLASANDSGLAIAYGYFHRCVEVNDVLPP